MCETLAAVIVAQEPSSVTTTETVDGVERDGTRDPAMHRFTATLEIIGVNPFVSVPEDVLHALVASAGKHGGRIPICGEIHGRAYRQTLVRYRGQWRLYVNTTMLRDSPRRIGENVTLTVRIDGESREFAMPNSFRVALDANDTARAVFERLPPSRRLEIVRYLARLKSDAARERNVPRAIAFLLGKGRFVGRDGP